METGPPTRTGSIRRGRRWGHRRQVSALRPVAAPILSAVLPDVAKRTSYAGSTEEIKPCEELAQDFQGTAWKCMAIQDFGQPWKSNLRPVTRGNCLGHARCD